MPDFGNIAAVPTSESKKLKICVLAAHYPRNESDPEASWLRQSVNLLAARGHDVLVVVPGKLAASNATIDGIRVLRFRGGITSHDNLLGRPENLEPKTDILHILLAIPSILIGAILLAWWIRKERVDVIDVHSPYPHGFMALLPAWLFGAKIVVTCSESALAPAQDASWGRMALGWFLKSADQCSSSSSHLASEATEISGRPVRIIPRCPNAAARLVKGAPRRDPQMPATLLSSGHLTQRGGLHYLIKALPIVLEKRDVRLFVTGAGECREECERLVEQLQLTKVVTFISHMSGSELGQLYQTSDIIVLPAIFDESDGGESLGAVAVEALINERPVIASAIGGIVEVIKHKRTGLLVPERSETALARAILRLLEDQKLARQLGRAGRDFAERHFNRQKVAGELEKLFYEAIDATPRRNPPLRKDPVLAHFGMS